MTELYYFGCDAARSPGHYLYDSHMRSVYRPSHIGCPWTESLMDGGLLKNGRRADIVNGWVWWTCGGSNLLDGFWHAMFWWDRSGDSRPGSNSGFYVRGVPWERKGVSIEQAFALACETFPQVVKRQKYTLVLQLEG